MIIKDKQNIDEFAISGALYFDDLFVFKSISKPTLYFFYLR